MNETYLHLWEALRRTSLLPWGPGSDNKAGPAATMAPSPRPSCWWHCACPRAGPGPTMCDWFCLHERARLLPYIKWYYSRLKCGGVCFLLQGVSQKGSTQEAWEGKRLPRNQREASPLLWLGGLLPTPIGGALAPYPTTVILQKMCWWMNPSQFTPQQQTPSISSGHRALWTPVLFHECEVQMAPGTVAVWTPRHPSTHWKGSQVLNR